jgi:molybdate transport system substrate-binding protein
MKTARRLMIGSGLAGLVLVFFLWWTPGNHPKRPAKSPLMVYCAAGLKPPLEATARAYEQAYGVSIQLQYGGSGMLLSSLRVASRGDLFVAADESYLRTGRTNGLIEEIIPLARMVPVIAVRRGNPKGIHSIEDLSRVEIALANPEAAAIGNVVRELLRKSGQWDALEKRARVFKPTVTDIANDIKLGTVDAGIVWDATVNQYPELEMVSVPAFTAGQQNASIGVLKSSQQPTAALHFARYLGARDKGLKQFEQFHYEPVDGDEWAEKPEIVLFSGAMLRPGIEKTLNEFERREGCRFTTVYNGCGILVAQMRAGQRPDAYFSCDTSFMKSVADLYLHPVNVVDNDLMIIVQKGNPKGIQTVQDLAKPGLRVGLPHHEKSAMGNIAWKMLVQMNLYDALGQNLKVESPTGDFLINQIRTGSLDAIIACRSNWTGVREHLDAIPIDDPLARMTQPYAVGRNTRYKQMLARLQDALTTATSRERFEAEGFGWRYQPNPAP